MSSFFKKKEWPQVLFYIIKVPTYIHILRVLIFYFPKVELDRTNAIIFQELM